jgi:hypothetical protein
MPYFRLLASLPHRAASHTIVGQAQIKGTREERVMTKRIMLAAALCLLTSAASAQQPATPQQPMRFFVSSAAPATGKLGGLTGADKLCQDLAAAAGAGARTWRAYLSTQAAGGQPAVNARDRIGSGP